MTDLGEVLLAFRAATQCEAAVWLQRDDATLPAEQTATPGSIAPPSFEGISGIVRMVVDGHDLVIATIPGPRRAWIVLGPCPDKAVDLEGYLRFLRPVVSQYLQSALEVEHAANELAERYEEINLLYTISEILGRTVSLDEATRRILTEVSETVGARRGTVLVRDPATDTLRPVAVLGVDPAQVQAIPVTEQTSVAARVFRTQHPMLAEAGELECELEAPYRRGAMLSVPIMWTAPDGAEPLGVVTLSDRRSGQPFTAGDQKLIAAIATQIGTAIENARLVRASLEQQRLAHEMQLAHDLQMKLLPSSDFVAPEAHVAARVVPAESVGGDFYNLFRLGAGRTGMMVGDVSGHGYQAALIMALAMSATNIQAQTSADPGETLDALLTTLSDELATTEMFISTFYAVVDPVNGELQYSNTGHPHAFVLGGDGVLERLAAEDPPLGMSDVRPTTVTRPWNRGSDLLVVFTDGISDARARGGERLGEERVLETIRLHRAKPPAEILDRVFQMLERYTQAASRRDDLTLVLLKS